MEDTSLLKHNTSGQLGRKISGLAKRTFQAVTR